MSSPIASSFSQGDAFISSKPERTITFTSSPPRRRAVRQQSIAVLPPPSTITRLPTLLMWPNETDDSQSRPIWMLAGGFLAARHVEIAAARRAGADEDGVEAFGQHRLHRIDLLVAELDVADVGDVAHFLVDHQFGETEVRDLGADEAAQLGILVVDHDLIAQHGEIARHGERGGAAADAGDALAVLLRRLGHAGLDAVVVLEIGGDALEAADRDRLLLAVHQGLVLDPAASAGRLAGAVAGAAEDSREDVGLPVDHVGVGISPVGDQPDVLGDRGVGGAGPLAVDDLVEVIRILDIGRLQQKLQAAISR